MKKRWYIFRTWFLCRERLIREVRELLDRADRLEAENEHLRHRRWRYCGRDIILPLNRIRIPIYMTPPRQDNLNACAEFYRQHGVVDRQIVVDRFGILRDGYIGYLVLKANGVEACKVLQVNAC